LCVRARHHLLELCIVPRARTQESALSPSFLSRARARGRRRSLRRALAMAAASAAAADKLEPPKPSVYEAYVADEAELAAQSPARRQGVGASWNVSRSRRPAATGSLTTTPPDHPAPKRPPPPKKTAWDRCIALAWPCVRIITRACGKEYLNL
jgi:hypothetical protein